MKKVFFWALIFLFALEGQAFAKWGDGSLLRKMTLDAHSVNYGGLTRFYEVHLPRGFDRSKRYPLVLVFHGGGSNPKAVRYESRMDEVSDRENFIAIYPAGTNRDAGSDGKLLTWNDGRPYKDGSANSVDDVGFVSALLDDVERKFGIDTTRVYAAGYSNGAQFTYRLAKQLSNRIAAIAVVAGQRPVNDSIPAPSKPISVLQFSGLKDEVGPYNGGAPNFEAVFSTKLEPVPQVIQSWAEFDGCPQSPSVQNQIGQARLVSYAPCKDNTEVALWTLEDGGHTWPGGRVIPAVARLVGPVNQDIFASQEMWKFFQKHTIANP